MSLVLPVSRIRKTRKHDHEKSFNCGHPRTLENIHRYSSHGISNHGERCKRCYNAYMRSYQQEYRKAGLDSWYNKQKRKRARRHK